MTDPILARRARVARLAATGKQVGYGLLLLAVATFVWGAVAGFSTAVTAVFAAAMALCTVILAPAIVFAYGVRAAEREDRGEQR
ncbi:MAG TPA: hypothetical protein VFA94_16205 [Acidimicrobiales bacterium]|nr:hypothetical protein [Acidimicrobiales bacterium]